MLASLASVFLEELTTFRMEKFCYEVNSMQFDALKDLVEQMLLTVGKDAKEDWSYYIQSKLSIVKN